MKNSQPLTTEEQAIDTAIENGEYRSVADLDARKDELAAAARYTLEKTRAINIRLSERDLLRIKAAAAKQGVSYQTLITSVLHKHV